MKSVMSLIDDFFCEHLTSPQHIMIHDLHNKMHLTLEGQRGHGESHR